jgi:hypothetical protein
VVRRHAECCYAECCYAECCYAECRYAECCYAECNVIMPRIVAPFHSKQGRFSRAVSDPYKMLQTLRQKEQLIDMIAGVQSHRMNEQRASAEFLPGNPTRVSGIHNTSFYS